MFGATSIPIGLILTQNDKDQIKLEPVKPVLLRPRFSSGDAGDDDLNLIGALRKKFEEASEAKPRGETGENGKTAQLVYIDDDNFPGAIRVTGTYTIENDKVRVKAFLRRDSKTIATLPEIFAAKDQAIDELLAAIRIELTKITK